VGGRPFCHRVNPALTLNHCVFNNTIITVVAMFVFLIFEI
jgi:hypothetical protein